MRFFYTLVFIVTSLIILGCSGSSAVDPIQADGNLTDGSSISGQTDTINPTNRYLWGLWKIVVNEDNTAEILYERNAENHFNVIRLLEVAPCSSCLTLSNFHFYGNDEFEVNLSLQHPFGGFNRFTGFDVRGILILNSDHEFPESGRSIAWGNDMATIVNPDGYTALFNPTEYPEGSAPFPVLAYIKGKYTSSEGLTATLNPYVAYKYDAPRRIFYAGEGSTRTVRIHAMTKPFEFGYAVDASWLPIDDPVLDPLNDFPPEANSIEAYSINLILDTSGLDTSAGSEGSLDVAVQDHQGLETIDSVTVEVPDLFTGTVELQYDTSDADGHHYTGTVTNELGAGIGNYPLLIRVADTETDNNLGVVDAWQVRTLTISDQATSEPIAIATAETFSTAVGIPIEFSDDGSYDPDGGDIQIYEWDWEADGTYDATGPTASHAWDEEGTFNVQFRVTDDEAETDTLDEAIEITIEGLLGNLTGVIRNGVDLEPLVGAMAETDAGGYQSDTTEDDGIYSLVNLPPGEVEVDFSAPGYIPASATFIIIGGETTVGDVVLLAPENPEPGNVTGYCIDATDGEGINMVSLEIREGINNLTGTVVDTAFSEPDGEYWFNDLDAGTYTIAADKSGYHPTHINVVCIGGDTSEYDVTMSPILGEGELRIVLTWAVDPIDLDSHLLTPDIEGQKYHIAFYSMGSQTSPPYASLDRDDVTSFGPETVTIVQTFPGRYRYFVHHWTGNGSISTTSDAVVRVYDWQGLKAEFHAPVTGEEGLWWDLFYLDGVTHQIDVIDEIVQTEPTYP